MQQLTKVLSGILCYKILDDKSETNDLLYLFQHYICRRITFWKILSIVYFNNIKHMTQVKNRAFIIYKT